MQERSEETHARILQESMRLFADSGYDATGVAEICEKSGVSKGAFYHHFPTKQAVFLAILDQWLDGLDQGLIGTSLEGSATVPEVFVTMARRTGEVFSIADGRLSIFLEFWAQARKDPEIWKRTVAPFRRYQGIFAGIIRRGIEEGSLRPVDPEMAASALVSLAVGVVLQGVVDPKGNRWDEVMASSVELLFEGMRCRDGKQGGKQVRG
jgi:AcrR family transcriptional regulator